MQRKVILPIFFALLIFIDQITKYLVVQNIGKYEVVPVIKGFFNLTFVLNPGAAFGLLNNQPPMFRKIFFLSVTTLACIIILTLLVAEFRYRVRSYAYVMIIAGAIGNAIDRVRLNEVVDFLDFYINGHHWYTFNFADCCVTVGVVVLLLDILFLNREKNAIK